MMNSTKEIIRRKILKKVEQSTLKFQDEQEGADKLHTQEK